jgi:hypothetical protein
MVVTTHMVRGDVQPISACIKISSSVWSFKVSFICNSSPSISYSLIWHLRKSSWGPWHLCLRVNLLLQLKQSLCALCFYISSQLNLLGVAVGVERFTRVMVVGTQFNNGGRVNLFVLVICSSLICSRLMVSFNFLGLNIQIPSAISTFNPLMKVPRKAFYVQSWTRLPSLSNFFW